MQLPVCKRIFSGEDILPANLVPGVNGVNEKVIQRKVWFTISRGESG